MTDFTFKTYRVEWVAETGYVDQYGKWQNQTDYQQPWPTRELALEDLAKRATWNERLGRWETGKEYHEGRVSYRETLV
ncbi:hypothetical protein EV128_12586 [Rhizobium azibense]|nr:hypothetical protein EV128_12586 [Rhizobium azibense]